MSTQQAANPDSSYVDEIMDERDNPSCYTCKHSFVTTGAPDFIGDTPGEISDGQTCWCECRKGREITDGAACSEWAQADTDAGEGCQ